MPAGEARAEGVIGLDVGGTKMAGGVVTMPDGRVQARLSRPTRATIGGEAVLAAALELVQELMDAAEVGGVAVRAIGLCVAELVNAGGRITSAQTIAWKGLPVVERLSPHAPALVESDVRAAALGEAAFGLGRPYRHFVYVTVGTGISSCLVQDGEPYAGARGNALVMASSPLTTVCTRCGSELHPVLEDIASGPAIVARFNALRPSSVEHGREVLAAADAGDATALRVVQTAGVALGSSVAFLANVLDPEAIVVGGGLGLAGGLYWEAFVRATREHIWAEATRALPILPAALGVDAGIVGAALAAWKRFCR
jgi:glucokinase